VTGSHGFSAPDDPATRSHGFLREAKGWWVGFWPFWALVVFAGLAATRLLPQGYARATVAVPIMLLVPGSLTLGAVFTQRHRPRAAMYLCYAMLLSAIWWVFAALLLYALNIKITADSTYLALLAASAALAIVIGVRRLLGSPGRGRRVARKHDTPAPDLSAAEAENAKLPAAARGSAYNGIAAVIAGAALLGGGLYAYDHLPHPAPTGYTWIAWAGPRLTGTVAIGPGGIHLRFQIVHHQPDAATFRLTATWLGIPSRPLAKSLTVRIGPDRSFRGTLFVPPPPDGCTYRIAVTLTDARQIAPTRQPQSWTINADVHDPGKPLKTCQ
jgi:hypothetical protein